MGGPASLTLPSSGVDFLVPVMGYICRICHKFCHSNSGGRLAHCKSLAHFENLQVSWTPALPRDAALSR